MINNNCNDCHHAAVLWDKIISLQDELRELDLENQRLNKIADDFYEETLDLKKAKRPLFHTINRLSEEIKTLRNQVHILDDIIYNSYTLMDHASIESDQLRLWRTRSRFYLSELKRLKNSESE